MDWVRSLRIGCGMISRGEVGLIVTAMGASTGIFGQPEVAVMVAVVLLTTLLTPLALRGTYQLKSPQDIEEGLADSVLTLVSQGVPPPPAYTSEKAPGDVLPNDPTFKMEGGGPSLLPRRTYGRSGFSSNSEPDA